MVEEVRLPATELTREEHGRVRFEHLLEGCVEGGDEFGDVGHNQRIAR